MFVAINSLINYIKTHNRNVRGKRDNLLKTWRVGVSVPNRENESTYVEPF